MTPAWFDQKDFKSQPWKNGQGQTLELVRIENPKLPGDFVFRLSMATVKTSGLFSQYAGIDRLLILVEGTHLIVKRADGNERRLHPLEIFSFAGEESVYGEVASPCVDFNIMTKRHWGSSTARVIIMKKGDKLKLPAICYLYQLEGVLAYEGNEKLARTLWEIKDAIEVESLTDSTSIQVEIDYLS